MHCKQEEKLELLLKKIVLDDEQAAMLARDIARRVEQEMTFPWSN